MDQYTADLLTDFPKIQCPFVRKTFKLNKAFQKRNEVYLAVDEVNPGYEWVFEDPDTFAVEKLDGTNVKILMRNGKLQHIQNRLNVIDMYHVVGGQSPRIVEGIFYATHKDYVPATGEYAGEVIGPKLQGNPYQLPHHLWYPFDRTHTSLRYDSFQKHPKTFENLSTWFKDWLRSRFYMKYHKVSFEDSVFAEGVIFYNMRRKAEGKTYMAKLRRDMFPWFYEEKGLKIIGYPEGGE